MIPTLTISGVGGHIVHAIGHDLAELLVLEVVHVHALRIAFGTIISSAILKLPNQFLLLGIDGDDGLLLGLRRNDFRVAKSYDRDMKDVFTVRLAIENAVVGCVSGNHNPSLPLALVGDSISRAYTPLAKMRRDRTSDRSCVKGKPSISTVRNSPPFVRFGRKQRPIVRYNRWIIVATLLCLSRQTKEDHQGYK